MQVAVTTALSDARTKGIAGKAVTPFLLTRIYDRSGGLWKLGMVGIFILGDAYGFCLCKTMEEIKSFDRYRIL